MNRRGYVAGCGAVFLTGCLESGETADSGFEICAIDVQNRTSETRTVTISLSSAETDAVEETFEPTQEEKRVVTEYGPALSYELSVEVDETSETVALEYETDIWVFVDVSDLNPPFVYTSTNCE